MKSVRHFLLGIILIAIASGILLVSDLGQRKTMAGAATAAVRKVAIVQHASQAALDEGVAGIIAGLAEKGFVDGRNIVIKRFNAENDLGTANAIAKQVSSGEFDLIVTSSTMSLQTVANANRQGKTKHVFGIVADPFSAGIGVTRENPAVHPKHITGLGSRMSVERALVQARELNPKLKSVGLVWNPAESNSQRFTEDARAACAKLGIKLFEGNAENSTSVADAANALVSRGAEAMLITGDVMVLVAADSVSAAARRGRIPVFSIIPPTVKRGSLFDLGANFYEVGKQTGELAGQVLAGADPGSIPVRDTVPEKLAINTTALAGLRDTWIIPPALIQKAALLIDAEGIHDRAAPPPISAANEKKFKIGLVYFAPEEGADLCIRGIFDGLKAAGIEEKRNLEVRRSHAQGEIANIPALLQNYDNQDVDVILTMTTPCLTGAAALVRNKPVVFTYVYDPIAAGAGKTRTDHLPRITGVGSFPPVEDTIKAMQQLVPGLKSVGTLYNSSEANSRKVVSVARELFKKAGIRLEEVTVTSSSEVLQAAQTLTHRNIQAMWVTGDNTALQGFDAVSKAAADAKLPLVINDPEFAERGALAAVGLGWYEAGIAAGKLVSRVLRGETPASLPFEEIAIRKLVVNDTVARKLGIGIPPEMAKAATHVTTATGKPK